MRVNSNINLEAGAGQAIYFAGERSGHIIRRDYGFVAVNRRGEPLGTFGSEREAVAAVYGHAGGAS